MADFTVLNVFLSMLGQCLGSQDLLLGLSITGSLPVCSSDLFKRAPCNGDVSRERLVAFGLTWVRELCDNVYGLDSPVAKRLCYPGFGGEKR